MVVGLSQVCGDGHSQSLVGDLSHRLALDMVSAGVHDVHSVVHAEEVH